MEVKTQTPEEIALEQNFNRMLRKVRKKNLGRRILALVILAEVQSSMNKHEIKWALNMNSKKQNL